jgi:TPR repeat protein
LPDAQFNLAAILAADLMVGGEGRKERTKGDLYTEAYMWVRLAAAKGHEGAREGVVRLSKVMSAAQIAEAERLVQKWKPKFEGAQADN